MKDYSDTNIPILDDVVQPGKSNDSQEEKNENTGEGRKIRKHMTVEPIRDRNKPVNSASTVNLTSGNIDLNIEEISKQITQELRPKLEKMIQEQIKTSLKHIQSIINSKQ